MSRRAKITPEQAGLPAGPNRRVAGLRRTEVALLADVSVEYYAKLERGAIGGASSSVLDAIARALLLDDTERTHLFDLARAADGIPLSGRPRRRTAKNTVSRPSLHWVLGSDHRRGCLRARPAPEPPCHQRARPGLLLAAHRRRRSHAEPRPVPVPRPGVPRLLPRLGAVR